MDSDFLLAQQLQKQFDEENSLRENKRSEPPVPRANPPLKSSIVDSMWELVDPNPDIHNLFVLFNDRFFWGRLVAVEVRWSQRMYSCAGICTYKGSGGCVVSLSLPLLKLRPRKDLVETLLHEMIHAYLFITKNNKDRDGHGPEFHKHMHRINQESGTNITVYHSFHDEVNAYRTHWWRCNGPCRFKPPYFGLIKRSTNRAPGPYDFWFAEHAACCAGTFVKIKEPDGFKSRKPKPKLRKTENKEKCVSPLAKFNNGEVNSDLKCYFPTSPKSPYGSNKELHPRFQTVPGSSSSSSSSKPRDKHVSWATDKATVTSDPGPSMKPMAVVSPLGSPSGGYTLGPFGAPSDRSKSRLLTMFSDEAKRPKLSCNTNESSEREAMRESVNCPVCNEVIDMEEMNNHLDACAEMDSAMNIGFIDASNSDEGSGESSVKCPCCNSTCPSDQINTHLDNCLQVSF